MSRPSLRESGLLFPIGIAVAFGLMVLWNIVFVTLALQTAPTVDQAYTDAVHR